MVVYIISSLHYSLHLYQPLLAEGAAQWLYDPSLQPSAEKSYCTVYNRDVI